MIKCAIFKTFVLKDNDLDWSAIYDIADEVYAYKNTSPEEFVARLQGMDVVILNKANINDEILSACPDLKWIGLTSTGYDNIDVQACAKRNIPVAYVPGYSTNSVAQTAMALLLETCHSCGRYDVSVRGGHWQKNVPASANIIPHMELAGKTIGLIGYGNIAQKFATMAKSFGMKVVCHTRTVRDEYLTHGVDFVSLDKLLEISDVISLHCPATEQTKNIINESAIVKCKNGVRIINTARGTLVDEHAVSAALNSKKIAAFATDVVSKEPIVATNPLLSAPNVIITPHIGWATPEALSNITDIVAKNLQSFLNGKPQNIINGVL